jgi:endonuclease/exonuclease/phosphatase family metal-dependent hydrolase
MANLEEAVDTNVLTLGSANLLTGGLDPDWSDGRWQKQVDKFQEWNPDVLFLQEMSTHRDPYRLWRHVWRTANALGMYPILGPAGGGSGNYPAILVDPSRLTIIESGSAPRPYGDTYPWCEALLQDRGTRAVIRVYSVHLPAGSGTQQLIIAEQLANKIAQRGEHAFLAGDFNAYSRADAYSSDALEGMPAHLRPVRMRRGPDGKLVGRYDVVDALSIVGLVDVAARLPGHQRIPFVLTPSGVNSGGRPDMTFVTPELWEARAIMSYEQEDTGASDHHFSRITVAAGRLAASAAPGPHL